MAADAEIQGRVRFYRRNKGHNGASQRETAASNEIRTKSTGSRCEKEGMDYGNCEGKEMAVSDMGAAETGKAKAAPKL